MIRTCKNETCGKEFEGKQAQRYCSPPCRPKYVAPAGQKEKTAQRNEEMRLRLLPLIDKGMTYGDIAKEFGVSKQAVFQYAVAAGLKDYKLKMGIKKKCFVCDKYFFSNNYSKHAMCSDRCRRKHDKKYKRDYNKVYYGDGRMKKTTKEAQPE